MRKQLNKFLQAVSQKVKVNEVIIFGSHVAGTTREDSDIDVLVVSDDFKTMAENDRLDLLYKASAFIEPDIHPWAFTAEELKNASTFMIWGYAVTKAPNSCPDKRELLFPGGYQYSTKPQRIFGQIRRSP